MRQVNRNKTNGSKFLVKVAMTAALVALLGAPAAWAVGTASNTSVGNMATISYQVNSVDQEIIESSAAGNSTPGAGAGSATTFLVDNRVDLTVADASGGNVSVTQNQQNAYLTFTVTNTGNTIQNYLLEVINGATAITMANVEIYIESNSTGGLQIGTGTDDTAYNAAVGLGDLDPNGVIGTDDVQTVYIVADVPALVTEGNTDTYWLRATTANAGTVTATGETSGADTAGVDVVFGDGDGDGAGADDADSDGMLMASAVFEVGAAASLSVQKTSAVYSDPFNGTTDPKAIPGAHMRYTIQINNLSTTTTAQSVVIQDAIPTYTDFVIDSVTGGTAEYSNDNGTTWTYSPVGAAGDPDAAVTDVRITVGDVANSSSVTVTFDVAIE